jgi:hypothetical protein
VVIAVYWLELMRDGNIGDRREVGILIPEAKGTAGHLCGVLRNRASRPQRRESVDTSPHHHIDHHITTSPHRTLIITSPHYEIVTCKV